MAMECSSSKRKVCSSSDRLTGLPIELLHTIFQLMPIKDIVRTSVLSTAWRNRWMYNPHLVFDTCSIPVLVEGQRTISYLECVNQVLFLHNADVSRFEIRDYPKHGSTYFDRWIRILGRKSVKELILHFLRGCRYTLPSSLFSCQNLRVLKLTGCNLSLSPSVKGFHNLIELYLERVKIAEETISSLIFNSPIEDFCLISCYGFRYINLCAPTLRMFTISGPCESISFENTPILQFADLQLQPLPPGAQVNRRSRNIEDVIGGAINVREIYVLQYFMEILAGCKVPERLSVPFHRLFLLSLEMNFEDSEEVLVAFCLLRSTPCLDQLEIINNSDGQSIHQDEGESITTRLQKREDIFARLETVVVYQFKGTQAEIDIIGFILLNAAILQTVSVKWDVSCIQDHQRKALVLENLMQYNRTSPKAQVIFANPALDNLG
ncbi:hypothetical protein ACHQM5_023280 [Ranunculus cassubicifolius]